MLTSYHDCDVADAKTVGGEKANDAMSAGMTSEAPVQRERRRDDDAGDRPLCALSAVGDDVIAASNALASVMDPTAEVVPAPPAERCRGEQRGKDRRSFHTSPGKFTWGVLNASKGRPHAREEGPRGVSDLDRSLQVSRVVLPAYGARARART